MIFKKKTFTNNLFKLYVDFYFQYEWEREYENLPPLADIRDNTLILHNTRFEDKGRYICKTTSDDGRTTTNYVDLVIKREYRRRRQNSKYDQKRRHRMINKYRN